MKPENRKTSKRNRHNGRINAMKAVILRDGKIIEYSDGTRYARMYIKPRPGSRFGYFSGPQVRVPADYGRA